MKKIALATFCFVLIFSFKSYVLKEETHRAINEEISQRTINGFNLDEYLIKQTGILQGKNEELAGIDANNRITTKRIYEWFGYGGIQEDRPGEWYDYLPIVGQPTRSVNHFHNPLKQWSEAGLNDTILAHTFTGQSSVLWAQNQNQNVGGIWSWHDMRQYFYIALTGKDFSGNTVATNRTERDKYFADTFRGVGQLMHLVQDASVPEHVRNDAHVMKAYEGYVEDFRMRRYGSLWSNLLATPIMFDMSILDISSTDSELAWKNWTET
jgi:hypothetical protein